MDDFEQFEAFDNQDKKEFNNLENQINNCIEEWDFECAANKIRKIKKFVTSKKDATTISNLQAALADAKEKKRAYEEAQRRANAKKSFTIGNCQNARDGAIMCTLRVKGEYDGNIFYKLENDGKYNIFILGSKNASNCQGFYDTTLHRVWTTRCGDSVFGASQKRFVYDLSSALKMYASCAINGNY